MPSALASSVSGEVLHVFERQAEKSGILAARGGGVVRPMEHPAEGGREDEALRLAARIVRRRVAGPQKARLLQVRRPVPIAHARLRRSAM